MHGTRFPGLRVAIGPVARGWGSWDWVGEHLLRELPREWTVSAFDAGEVPEADVVLLIKHWPGRDWVQRLRSTQAVIYAPIDFLGGIGEIEAAALDLRRCQRIVVHCRGLARCFSGIARTVYLDHPLKFVNARPRPVGNGPLLWVGVTSNLPPVVEWLRHYELNQAVVLLSNFPADQPLPTAAALGLPTRRVRCERWSPERHLALLPEARAAFDIKDESFRSRHKPPAKALDFLASGMPLALQPDSSSAHHLRELGFAVADPADLEHWLSAEYAAECAQFGLALRELLSPPRIALRWRWLIEEVLCEQGQTAARSVSGPQPIP